MSDSMILPIALGAMVGPLLVLAFVMLRKKKPDSVESALVMRGEHDDLFDDDEPKKDAECGAGDKP